MDAEHNLQGLRVLVAEDEILVAMLIEEMCADLGCEVVGPAGTLGDALERSRGGDFDVALVDMNLAGLKADPVIAELHGRSVPFAIASGGGEASNDPRATMVLDKPFSFAELTGCLRLLAAQARPRDVPENGS
jgi:CheY-like chemotaxis protein